MINAVIERKTWKSSNPTLPSLAPVLASVRQLSAFGRVTSGRGSEQSHAFAAPCFGRLRFLGVATRFPWHAAHRLQVTHYDFGLRQDAKVAVVVYLVAAAGTLLTVLYLVRI
jgi:fumarate reductase subunit D